MEPNSVFLVIALLAVAAAAIAAAVRLRPVAVKVVAGVLAMVLSAGAGIAVVNDYYAYYQTWSQLSADLNGSYSSFSSTPVANRTTARVDRGRVESITLAGPASGITRRGLVYLPPQYFQSAYSHVDFPVVELVHGSPGTPQNWIVQMRLAHVLDHLIGEHLMGPVIAVMPTMAVGDHFEECLNVPGAADDTYLTQDVRTDVEVRFRTSQVPAEWGLAGYSSGGYCAANLALRHRSSFGAIGIMDGYFRPTDGPAAAALHDNQAAERANDPLLAARRLASATHPLPSFWVMAGTGDAGDYAGAKSFVRALRGLDAVTVHAESGATHNFDAWRAADPAMLTWLWTQLAAPSLRVQFPLAASVGLSEHPPRHRRSSDRERRPVPHRSNASTTATSPPAYRAARDSTAANDAAARVQGKP
ncbi:alpha/beta hydrolase [uncultured Jatrophihabitans sp.]|uniref:alpha/beta hydrolase n=1 Tax=uncultured Jatrophihabitans sp. TaxID=1610747 RepID=UPI0035C993AC